MEFNLIKNNLIQSDDLFIVINNLPSPAWVEDIRLVNNIFYWDERFSTISWGETQSIELPQGEYRFIDFVQKDVIRHYAEGMSDFTQLQRDYIIDNFHNKRNVFIIKYTEKYYRDLKLNRLLL